MLLPAVTGSGVSTLVIDNSAIVPTVVVAVALLLPGLPSADAEVIAAVFDSTLPPATAASTATTRVNAELPTAKLACVQSTVPLAPTAGVVQLQPAGDVKDTKLVPTGRASLHAADVAAFGPLLVAVIA